MQQEIKDLKQEIKKLRQEAKNNTQAFWIKMKIAEKSAQLKKLKQAEK
jgi:cell division septum initiation protein DivIVA